MLGVTFAAAWSTDPATDFFKVGLQLLVILGVVNVFLLDWYWPLTG